jgi:NAD(P)H-nitrite reductase large subunit
VRIDRCVCHKVEFATVKRWLEANPGSTFSDMQQQFKCGTGGGLCGPSVRRTMRTGEVVFHQIVSDRDEPLPPRPSDT